MLNKINLLRNTVLVLFSAFFLACENPTDIIFGDLGDGNSVSYYTDTLSLETATFLMDSSISSNQAAALVGTYSDPLFGRITASAYLQPTLANIGQSAVDSFILADNIVYDSLYIRLLNRQQIFYGDSLPHMTLNVHRLRSPLESTKNYNYNESIPFEPESIGSIELNIEDFSNAGRDSAQYIYIKLPDTMGQELFALANTDAANEKEAFTKAFPGFVITADTGAETVAALTLGPISADVSSLILYYHTQGSSTISGHQFEFTAGRFNKIETDRSNTVLASLILPSESLPSNLLEGRAYVQAGNGTATKLSFPGLAALNNPQISSAIIRFSADTTAFTNNIPRAPFITFVELGSNNSIKRENNEYRYVSPVINTTVGILSTYVDSTNTFTADITPYLQSITSKNAADNGIALVASIPSSTGTASSVFNAGLNRIVLKDFRLFLYYSE